MTRTILWSTGFARSHTAATIGLARKLRRKGHRILYLTPPGHAERVREAGFDVILPELRTENGTFEDLVDYVERGGVQSVIRHVAPDLVLSDVLLPHPALIAERTGVPAALVAPLFLSTRDPGVPPSGIARLIVPKQSWTSRLAIRLAWQGANLRLGCREAFFALARRWGVRSVDYLSSRQALQALRAGARGELHPFLMQRRRTFLPGDMPVLVLCPKVLEYPRPEDRLHHYIGPCLDFESPDPAVATFPWNAVDRRRKLILCMLGDLPDRRPALCRRFWRVLFAALGDDRGLQLVVSAGRASCEAVRAMAPPSAIVVDEAPRFELLRRGLVALQLSHGGLNSIKQSVYFGVPLLVCPHEKDQWANAGRVCFHGVGLHASLRRPRAARLRAAVATLLGAPPVMEKVRQLSRTLQEVDRSSLDVDAVETLLR